jgi:hypothetical protein
LNKVEKACLKLNLKKLTRLLHINKIAIAGNEIKKLTEKGR